MKKAFLGVLLGVSTLAYLVFHVGSEEATAALLQAELVWLGVGAFLKLPVMWLKSKRWAIAIQQATRRPVQAAFTASMIGFAGNLILPARLGEWARVSVIDKHNRTGRTLALSALMVTQVLDLLLLVIGFMMAGSYLTERFLLSQNAAATALLMVSMGLLAVFLFLPKMVEGYSGYFDAIIAYFPSFLTRAIKPKFSLFTRGLTCLQQCRAASRILLLTLLAWMIETASVFAVLLAFQIDASPLMAVVLVIVSNLGFLLPLTPGNIGVAQAVSILVLGIFDVPGAPALAYGLAHQALLYAIVISVGLLCFYREGMSVKLLGRSGSDERPDHVPQPSGL